MHIWECRNKDTRITSNIGCGAVRQEYNIPVEQLTEVRPFSTEDLLKYRLIRDIQISPCGEEVIFELKSINEKKDNYKTKIWIASAKNREVTQFTRGTGDDTYPRWSPDGERVAFLSDRNGKKSQVYIINREGGEARQLTHFKESVKSIAWSPCGESLAIRVTVLDECRPKDDDSNRWKKRPKEVTHQRYKSDSAGFLLHSHTHLFIVSMDGGTRQITEGKFDITGPAWSPDGKKIVYCRSRTGLRESHISDVWVSDADGKNANQLSGDIPSAMHPVWSPDGRWIVFVGCSEAGDSIKGLWLINPSTGDCRTLGDSIEVSSFPLPRSGSPIWSSDSKHIAFLLSRNSLSEVATVNISNGEIRRIITGERQITNLHANEHLIAFAGASITEPGDISVARWNGSEERRLTFLNDDWWRKRTLPKVTLRKFKMQSGEEIEGWLLLPDSEQNNPIPFLTDVHGGPHSFVEFGFPYHVYWYVLASRGWGVLALNPIGSSSYGKEFAHALRGQWGELDLPQHLEAIEQLQKEGLSATEVVIAGKSYGGYMSAWAIGHTNRFCAAIVSAPVANLETHTCTSDSGYYVCPYAMEGDLNEKRDLFQRLSPVNHLSKAKTPTLILQGEEDQRCPIGQSEEVFSILMRERKAPVEMVIYPGGHHDLAENGRPSHRLHYHSRIVEWCEKWMNSRNENESNTRRRYE